MRAMQTRTSGALEEPKSAMIAWALATWWFKPDAAR